MTVQFEERDDYIRVVSRRGNPESDYRVKLNRDTYIVSAGTRRVAVNRAMRVYEQKKGRDIPSWMKIRVKEVSGE